MDFGSPFLSHVWKPICIVLVVIFILVARVFAFYYYAKYKTRSQQERVNEKVSYWLASNTFPGDDDAEQPLLDSRLSRPLSSPRECRDVVIDMDP